MGVQAVFRYGDDEYEVAFKDGFVYCGGVAVASRNEIDDLIEALQRIKADLARAKGGA